MKIGPRLIAGSCLAPPPARTVFLFALTALTSPPLVFGHASLVHSSPAPYVRLEQPPDRIELSFNERIERVFHSVRIIDSQGREVESQEAHMADGGETLVMPLPVLPPEAYGVYWRINSLDGHQVQGQFGFGVASDPPSEGQVIAWQPTAGPGLPPWFFPLLKGLSVVALSLWLGAYGALALNGSAAIGATCGAEEQAISRSFAARSWQISLVSGTAFLVLDLLALWGKTAAFTGAAFSSALSIAGLKATLGGSSFGHWWAARFGSGFLLLLLTALSGPQTRRSLFWWLIRGVTAAVIIASIAVTGHAQSAGSQLPLAAVMQGLHLAASVMWVGGVFYLAIGVGSAVESMRPASEGGDDGAIGWLSSIAPRFSRLAQIAVAVIFITGIYNSWLHVPSWSAFWTTAYGRSLLGKLFWVALTLSVALVNWRKVLPELARLREGVAGQSMGGSLRWVPRFPMLLQSEFAGCLIIFATVAMLTNMPPASADLQADARELRAKAGAYEVVLGIKPARLGASNLRVSLLDAAGAPVSQARKVTIYLRSLEMDMGLATAEALTQPDGSYSAEMTFSMRGRWRVSVEVSPPRGDGFVVEYDVTIS